MVRPHHCLLVLACSGLLLAAVVGGDDAKPAPPAKSPAEIDRLIKQLGNDDFDQREAASKALEAMGEPALNALLRAATKSNDAEVRRRANDVVKALTANLYRESRCFTGHKGPINSVALSPDGKWALVGRLGQDGTAQGRGNGRGTAPALRATRGSRQ